MITIHPYVPDPGEHPEITALREANATKVREWVREYVEADCSDLDFAYSLHLLTYGHAKIHAKRAIELWQKGADLDGTV